MLLGTFTVSCCVIVTALCIPVDPETGAKAPNEDLLEELNANGYLRPTLPNEEYKNYMKEVISVLEEDENIKQLLARIGDENEPDVENYINMASQQTRTKLDELKRLELHRLKNLHKIQRKIGAEKKKIGRERIDLAKLTSSHIDIKDPDSFSLVDLKKLISKSIEHLSTLDKRRKGAFRDYEIRKEYKFRESIKELANKDLSAALQAHRDAAVRHRKHPDLHHPISRAQLEEVWKRVDYMEPGSFDPRLFFMLHDLDGDMYLSITEIEALFQNELDKAYNASNPEDDTVERNEEMNRMREHVFVEVDADRDGMISWGEFLASTRSEEFNKDSGWKTLDGQLAFSEEELQEYKKLLNPSIGEEPPVQPVAHA